MNKKTSILIFAAGHLGDNIMVGSLIIKLKQQSNPQITVLNPHPNFNKLFERMPGIDNVINTKFTKKKLELKKRIKVGIDLKKHNFDEIIYAPNTLKSAIIGIFAGIKKRTGWHQGRYLLLNNRHLGKAKTQVQGYVQLAYPPGPSIVDFKDCPKPILTNKPLNIFALAKELNITLPDEKKKNIMFCPGSAWGETKRWPVKQFINLGEKLLQDGYNIHILGGIDEVNAANEINSALGNKCIDWTNKTKLDTVIDILSTSSCVIANDSGLMHMGCAINVPVIAIYGASPPKYTPPLSDKASTMIIDIECRPCGKRICPKENHLACLFGITPEAVYAKTHEMLELA